jgi:hypothetical protein
MKTFKQLIAEVAQPNNEDELNFKEKHSIEVIDHPASKETQHSSEKRSPRRRADYDEGEDEDVYEAKMDPVGQEDGDIDNDGDEDDSDEYLHARRKAIAKAMKEAKMDPVGQEDDDINNDGDTDSSDEYLHARRKAIAKAMKKESLSEAESMAAIGRKLQKMAPKEKNDMISNAMANLGDHLESFGTPFGAKNMKDLEKKTGLTAQIIQMLIKRASATNESVKEASTSPYAIGMASAMKQTGDKPPLKKSTITKAHKIAKSIMKDESVELGEAEDKEAAKRNKNFWKFAGMTNKEILDSKAKAEKKATKESVQIDEANEKKIIAGINAGDSIDVIVQNNLNRRGDNKDEILKVIRDYNWKKRMKKENVEQIDEVSKPKLKNYMDAARKDMRNRYYDDSPESDKKFANRSKGIERALDKRDANSKAKVPATESVNEDVVLDQIRASLSKKNDGTKVIKDKSGYFHIKYKDSSHKGPYHTLKDVLKGLNEENELMENFKAGAIKLNDGSSVIVKDQDAKLLNKMFADLNADNKKRMMKVAMADKSGFNEILGFAREAL